MFLGYQSESDMRQQNPQIADQIIAIAETQSHAVCTRGKNCVGSIDGKEFMYADGSKDFGETITTHRAKLDGVTFRWQD